MFCVSDNTWLEEIEVDKGTTYLTERRTRPRDVSQELHPVNISEEHFR